MIVSLPSNGAEMGNWKSNSRYVFQQESVIAGHYVVIGAYQDLDNAEKLLRRVKAVGLDPKSFRYTSKDIYYIYMFIDDSYEEAHRVSRKLREVNFIRDAWVFSAKAKGPLTASLLASADTSNKDILTDVIASTDVTTVVENKEDKPVKKRKYKIPKEFQEDEKSGKSDEFLSMDGARSTENTTPSQKSSANNTQKKSRKEAEVATTNHQKGAKGNRKLYDSSSPSIGKLVSAKKGEMIVFENILFHKNASVLRKTSADELSRLNRLLQTNKDMNIKIHGHTNGDFKGEIILLTEDDNRFFKQSGKNIIVKGDDKKLSRERANVLKRYLVSNGINETRIQVQGWGDRRMLYPKDHLKSSKNRRVEIEVLE